MVRSARLERATSGLEIRCSIQLSYERNPDYRVCFSHILSQKASRFLCHTAGLLSRLNAAHSRNVQGVSQRRDARESCYSQSISFYCTTERQKQD
jgi:hypothetical protein